MTSGNVTQAWPPLSWQPPSPSGTIGPTMGPSSPIDPVDQLLWKWFGGGSLGSAIFQPTQWFTPPSAFGRPNWNPGGTPMIKTSSGWQPSPFFSSQRTRPQSVKTPTISQATGTANPSTEPQAVAGNPADRYAKIRLISQMGLYNPSLDNMSDEEIDKIYMQVWGYVPQLMQHQLQQQQFEWQQAQAEKEQKTAQQVAEAKSAEAGYNQYIAMQEQVARDERQKRDFSQGQMQAQLNAQAAYGQAVAAKTQLEQMMAGFETMRNEIMSSTAPRDWVKREKARLAVNPYQEALVRASTSGGWGSPTGAQEQVSAEPMTGEFGGPVYQPPTYRQSNPNIGVNPWMARIPINPTPKYSGTPNVPSDVQGFLQGNQGFGAPIETPSGQGWFGSPWSTREGVIGYGEAMNLPESDLWDNIKKMLPNAPSRGSTWGVARQR